LVNEFSLDRAKEPARKGERVTNLYVGITDNDWFRFLSARPDLDEVNFWQPSGSRRFRALSPGDPFLFKLHHPENFIVGGGIFEHFTLCSIDLAWEAFGQKNGVAALDGMRRRLAHYRHQAPDPRENYVIGCIILKSPVFLPRHEWIPAPADLAKNVVQGKTYDISLGTGRALWDQFRSWMLVRDRTGEIEPAMFGNPRLMRQRLGQGGFRLLVTDTYERQCAISRERALPVLEAAHIKPVAEHGHHRIDNGLLLRSDIHTLFDRGYISVTADHRVRVSNRLKRDFDNGEHYYQLNGSEIWLPRRADDRPNEEFLEWHARERFRG
jgi:putative restriction endonuclease